MTNALFQWFIAMFEILHSLHISLFSHPRSIWFYEFNSFIFTSSTGNFLHCKIIRKCDCDL